MDGIGNKACSLSWRSEIRPLWRIVCRVEEVAKMP